MLSSHLNLDITEEQRASIRQVIVDGAETGANPRAMARDSRDSIGLTPNQEAAVRSYRFAIDNADWSDALGRELSDGRSDRTLAARQRDGGKDVGNLRCKHEYFPARRVRGSRPCAWRAQRTRCSEVQ